MDFDKKIINECGTARSVDERNRNYKIYKGFISNEMWIGEPDASKEWRDNKELSKNRFIPTESYNIFTNKHQLFLFGRRGTGKTAILQMMNHNINKKSNRGEFQLCYIIRKQDHLRLLTMSLRSFQDILNKGEMVHVTKCVFKWLIYLSAMHKIVSSKKIQKCDEKIRIKKFLDSKNLIKTEKYHISYSPIQVFVDILTNFIVDKDGDVDYNASMLWTLRELESKDYMEALNDAITILNRSKKSCLILIDSQERYAFNDNIFANSITGLIEAILEIDKDYSFTKIKAKVAFPSEIVPHMSPENKGKSNTKSHYIFWKYDDIVKLIYARYQLLINPELKIDTDDENSLRSIYELIPSRIYSYSNIEHDTLSYIINHTQKKPREVIQLFNKILSLAKQADISIDQITSQCIREATNSELKDLSSAVLDMYSDIYLHVYKVVSKTFTDKPNLMTYGDLQKNMREAKSLFSEYKGINIKHQVERLFAESGIIGKATKFSDIRGGVGKICHAIFEYQIKGGLTFQSHDILVVHPMFYQEFNTMVFDNALVIPNPTLEEQELIKKLSDQE